MTQTSPANKIVATVTLSEAELLVRYIEQEPRCRWIVELTKQGKTLPPESQSALTWLISLLIAAPNDFYGKAYVTDTLKEQAALTANINTVANWVDFISNYPFYFFSFQFLGNIPACMLGLLLNGAILWSSNLTAAVVANRHQKNRCWANVGIQGTIALSVLKSIVSGVGVELLNNPTGIKQQTANYLIQTQIERVEQLKVLDSPLYLKAKQACQEGEAQFSQMNKEHSHRNALYAKLYGTWAQQHDDRKPNWKSLPIEQVPDCVRANLLFQSAHVDYEAAKKQMNQTLSRRVEIGNDLMFLKKEMPNVYAAAFTESGEIASPVMQVQMATLGFFGKLVRGEFASLGFALFFFSLSIITSAIAVLITIRYAQREDVQLSRDEDFARERDRLCDRLWRELVEQHEQELSTLKKKS